MAAALKTSFTLFPIEELRKRLVSAKSPQRSSPSQTPAHGDSAPLSGSAARLREAAERSAS